MSVMLNVACLSVSCWNVQNDNLRAACGAFLSFLDTFHVLHGEDICFCVPWKKQNKHPEGKTRNPCFLYHVCEAWGRHKGLLEILVDLKGKKDMNNI